MPFSTQLSEEDVGKTIGALMSEAPPPALRRRSSLQWPAQIRIGAKEK
jgi:hypothetical protein